MATQTVHYTTMALTDHLPILQILIPEVHTETKDNDNTYSGNLSMGTIYETKHLFCYKYCDFWKSD